MPTLPSVRPVALAALAGVAALAACSDAAPTTAPVPASAGTATAAGPTAAGAPDAADVTDVPGAVWAPGAPGADSVGGLGRVAGATVRALREPALDEVARVTTGSDGAFTFRALPGGLYTFVAAPPAGSPLVPQRMQSVTVARGQFGTMTIPGALAPSAPSTLHPYRALNIILWPPR